MRAWWSRVLGVVARCFPSLEQQYRLMCEDRISGRWLRAAQYERSGVDAWSR